MPQQPPSPPRVHNRPSPLRTSTVPTAASSISRRLSTAVVYDTTYISSVPTSSVDNEKPIPIAQYERNPEVAVSDEVVSPPRERTKSIFSRLRNSIYDPSIADLGEDGSNSRDDPEKIGTSSVNKRRSTSKWDKRASRKPPPPPSKTIEEDGPVSESSRQSARQLGGVINEEKEDLEWNRLQVLPKVFLIPPEEEEVSPITLYPPPPPPTVARPLINFPPSDSRPISLLSLSSESEQKNTWGGMAASFGQAPPVFRRGRSGGQAPRGVIMPKKKDEVVRDRERRMSMYTQDEMDWSSYIETSNGGVVMSPPRRLASAPPRIDSLPIQTPMSPPRGIDFEREAMPLPPLNPPNPPRIMITSDSANSLRTEDSHCQSDITITEEPEDLDGISPPASDIGQSSRPTEVPAETVTDSPIRFTPPQLPEPLPTLADDAPPSPPTADPIALSITQESDSNLPQPNRNLFDSTLPRSRHSTAPPILKESAHIGPSSAPHPEATRFTSNSALLSKSAKSRNRRSMSLTSILAPKPQSSSMAHPLPPLPAIPADAARPVVRKQKSLKKFFFSTGDLAKEERGPDRPKPVVKEKAKPKDKERKPSVEKTAESETITPDFGPSVPVEKKDKHRTGFGMLSRPKSKPSLRIDVKATKVELDPSPASAPLMTGSSTSSGGGFPETPSSRTSSGRNGGGKSTSTPAPEANGRGLSKRFSLSNMSTAFRRGKKDSSGSAGASIPRVPDLPDVYRAGNGKEKSTGGGRDREVKESAVPLSPTPRTVALPLVDSPQSTNLPLLPGPRSPYEEQRPLEPRSRPSSSDIPRSPRKHLSMPGTPTSIRETASIISDTSSTFELEDELNHAQLMHVSPRTRRNPAESLQDILGVGPLAKTHTLVELEPTMTRRSVEAIVLGPLLLPTRAGMEIVQEETMSEGTVKGRMTERYDSESSLDSLSESSSTSGDHPPPVTPSSPPFPVNPGRMAPPLPVPTENRIESLPALPSDCVMVDRPQTAPEVSLGSPISASSPAKRKSPEGLFRFFGSPKGSPNSLPRGRKSLEQGPVELVEQIAVQQNGTGVSVPPQAYSSLNRDVQLKSLHFEGFGLDLDFDGFGLPPLPIGEARENALGLMAAVEIEEMA